MRILISFASAALLCGVADTSAAVLLSTGFSTPTGTDGIPYTDATTPGDNGNKTVGWVGTSWTVGNAALVDLKQVTSVTFGNFTWGSAADTIKAGEFWTTLGGGDHIDGNNSSIRHTGATTPLIQFNSSSVGNSSLAAEPDGTAIFNLVFEAKSAIEDLAVSLRAGTAQTSGSFDNNTAAQNGNFNIRIVDATNTASGFDFYATSQAIGAGAGPVVNAVDQSATQLAAGTYVLQIVLSGKTSGQRYSIDDFAFSANAVPEPVSLGLLALGAGALVRRRRA